MVKVNDIMSAIDTFVDSRLNIITGSNPLLSLAQPFLKRGVKRQISNYTDSIKKSLNLLADNNGNIDIENIFDEVIERFNTMDPITVPTENMGDIVVGKGKLTLEIPSLFGGKPRNLVFTSDDIIDFKSMIINK